MKSLQLRDDQDEKLLLGALETQHSWCLDALAHCVVKPARTEEAQEGQTEAIERCMDERKRILRLAAEIGRPINDSYRMTNIRRLADENGVDLPDDQLTEVDHLGPIKRDERRWTLGRSYATGAPTAKEGPFLPEGETVEVVPVSQLAGAVNTIEAIRKLTQQPGLSASDGIEAIIGALDRYDLARGQS